jgi:hypothetical protein
VDGQSFPLNRCSNYAVDFVIPVASNKRRFLCNLILAVGKLLVTLQCYGFNSQSLRLSPVLRNHLLLLHVVWSPHWFIKLLRYPLMPISTRMKVLYRGHAVVQWLRHAVVQWLRHCATNRKVAGSIPDGVIGIFHWHNPSGRTMALGSTQTLTEMSTRNISFG